MVGAWPVFLSRPAICPFCRSPALSTDQLVHTTPHMHHLEPAWPYPKGPGSSHPGHRVIAFSSVPENVHSLSKSRASSSLPRAHLLHARHFETCLVPEPPRTAVMREGIDLVARGIQSDEKRCVLLSQQFTVYSLIPICPYSFSPGLGHHPHTSFEALLRFTCARTASYMQP